MGLADCGCRETEINVNIYAGSPKMKIFEALKREHAPPSDAT